VKKQLERTETTESIPEDAIFMATKIVGESTRAAVAAAEAWLAEQEPSEAAVEAAAVGENHNQSDNNVKAE
jgi:hypothetical protein